MLPQSAEVLCDEVVYHMSEKGEPYSAWYCGIASDWEGRLFNKHKVPRDAPWYIVGQCYSTADARSIERYLLELGCDGGGGGDDRPAVYVYAYLKTRETEP